MQARREDNGEQHARPSLRRELEQAQGERPLPERMTNQIRQLLARSPALARVREGLVRVLSGVEGVTATEGERDSLGRPATRYDQPSIDGTVLSLFVDAGSARLLEEVTVVGTDGIAEPTEAPVAPAVPESTPEPQPAPGTVLYRETWLSWTTAPPPSS